MLDLDLLRSFVSVVDAGGFTRAGERVHRTQSTVSQQIRRLEETFGRALLHRTGKHATPTEEGERLLSYARRILALAEEARDVVARPGSDGVVRLGIPEDFAANRLAQVLSRFARSRPGLRLDVRCDLSVKLRSDLERGELDLALMKRDAGETGAIAVWPEELNWVTSRSHPIDPRRDPCRLPCSRRAVSIAIAPSTRWKPPDVLGISPIPAPTSPASKPRSPPASASASCLKSRWWPTISVYVEGRIPRDHEYGAGTGGGSRRRPRNSPPRRPAGRFLQRRRSTTGGVIWSIFRKSGIRFSVRKCDHTRMFNPSGNGRRRGHKSAPRPACAR